MFHKIDVPLCITYSSVMTWQTVVFTMVWGPSTVVAWKGRRGGGYVNSLSLKHWFYFQQTWLQDGSCPYASLKTANHRSLHIWAVRHESVWTHDYISTVLNFLVKKMYTILLKKSTHNGNNIYILYNILLRFTTIHSTQLSTLILHKGSIMAFVYIIFHLRVYECTIYSFYFWDTDITLIYFLDTLKCKTYIFIIDVYYYKSSVFNFWYVLGDI